jgi:hypothetical protein
MTERFRVFWDAKLGRPTEEYEDAFWPDTLESGSGLARRYAVADGATESSYSRHWATLLVEAYGLGAIRPRSLVRALPGLQATWRSSHESPSRSWFAAEKIAMGAFAALLGVSIAGEGAERRLSGLAVGDCCLVVVRDDDRWSPWPIVSSADFGLNPAPLSSSADSISQRSLMRSRHVRLVPGDSVFMMSDAIAAWFLREAETGGRPWTSLSDLAPGDDERFRSWSRGIRQAGFMRDDDVTVAIVDAE